MTRGNSYFVRLFIIMMISSLTIGCSLPNNKPTLNLSGKTYTLQLPISDTQLMNIGIPEEFPITMSDNFTYWQLARDTTIYLMDITNHMAADKTDVTNLYQNSKSISYDYADKTITIRCDSDVQEVMKEYLLSATITESDTRLSDITKLDKFPKHGDVVMKMYDNNLYMPEGAQETKLNIYTASLCTSGADFIMSWICDGKRDEVCTRLTNICLANSGSNTLTAWYVSDDIFLAKAGENVVGMKKLRANEWYVYTGTTPYVDYILKGLKTVHGGGK